MKSSLWEWEVCSIANIYKPCLSIIDNESGEVFLDAPKWGEEQKEIGEGVEREVHFPADMLNSKQLSRMITFSSKEAVEAMSLA